MEITLDLVEKLNEHFNENQTNKLAMNAVGRVDLQELAVNRDLIKGLDFSFSDEIDVAPEATAQQKVGVCWMFAALNLMRFITQKKINVKSFEYSGPYLMFWDKLEKANYFLEKIIEFRNLDYNDTNLRTFLQNPLPDGGDWYMFVNLVKKYGVVPSSVMQHSSYSKDSTKHNEVISSKLREYASLILKMAKDGKSLEEIQAERVKFTEEIYKILVICFGRPPLTFNWSYKDEDKKFFREKNITPHQFYEKYIGHSLEDYVSVWSTPLDDTPYNKMFTMSHTRKMVGGDRNLSLNLPFDTFKEFAIKKMKNQEPCVFSCDVGKDSLRKEGFLVKGIFNYDLIFQTKFSMDKKTRLAIGETQMTHCMLLVGVDLEDDKPIKWKVENSWGTDVGKKGFFVMSDEWFNENVFQLVVPKKYLNEAQLEMLKQEPIVLPLWHPMS